MCPSVCLNPSLFTCMRFYLEGVGTMTGSVESVSITGRGYLHRLWLWGSLGLLVCW